MIAEESDEDRIEHHLDQAYEGDRAADMLEQEQPAGRAQDAPDLGDGLAGIGDRAEHKRAHDAIERLISEWQRLRVTEP